MPGKNSDRSSDQPETVRGVTRARAVIIYQSNDREEINEEENTMNTQIQESSWMGYESRDSTNMTREGSSTR